MATPEPKKPAGLERREFELSLFTCLAIVVLSGGLAVLMYPAVFSNGQMSPTKTPQIAYYGFCFLSCMLVIYIVDRQATIRRLRAEIAADRQKSSAALRQASVDLLATMPDFHTFEDRLTMEFRRATVAHLSLSVLIIRVDLHEPFLLTGPDPSAFGDAAKAISRKLREQDSIYNVGPGFFGVILPEIDLATAKLVSGRLSDGLYDAAGASDRFSFSLNSISYPEQTASVHDMELMVRRWMPEEDIKQTLKHAHVE